MDRDTAAPDVTDLPGDRAREWVAYHHESAAPSTYVYEFVWDRTAPAEATRRLWSRSPSSIWSTR